MKPASTGSQEPRVVRPGTEPTLENQSAGSRLSKDAVVLGEKLLARLPETGGLLILGSISESAKASTPARELGLALQFIGGKPILLVEAGGHGLTESQASQDSQRLGLTDVLAGSATLEQALQPTRGEDLACLGGGKASGRATELVMSEAFRSFIKTARDRFHWVIVHCPHLLDHPHAASLIARSQAVVATLERGRGRAESVQTLRDLCNQLNTLFAGVILV